jgi:hypothetical protein
LVVVRWSQTTNDHIAGAVPSRERETGLKSP